MTYLIRMRSAVREFIGKNEGWALRLFRFIICAVALLVLNSTFGYQKTLSHWWVAILVAFLCMFMPMRGASVVIALVCLMQLATLNTGVAVVAIVLLAMSYGICAYLGSYDTYNFLMVPVGYQLHIPYVMPIGSGLFRDFGEVATILSGSVMSFYLKTVKENANLFLDETADMSVSKLIQNLLLGNTMFYLYLTAMVTSFMLVYYIRNLKIKNAWLWSTIAGIGLEFVIMLAGCLFVGRKSDIPTLIVGNIICLAVSLVMVFFLQGLDYTRTERVQYEDDEYYYYVTAVPKAHIAESAKEVKTITTTEEPVDRIGGVENVEQVERLESVTTKADGVGDRVDQ